MATNNKIQSLEHIDGKIVKYSTITSQYPGIFVQRKRNTGELIISTDTDIKYGMHHIYVGGEHIASGYGFPSMECRDSLTYVQESYNGVFSYLNNRCIYLTDAYESLKKYVDESYSYLCKSIIDNSYLNVSVNQEKSQFKVNNMTYTLSAENGQLSVLFDNDVNISFTEVSNINGKPNTYINVLKDYDNKIDYIYLPNNFNDFTSMFTFVKDDGNGDNTNYSYCCLTKNVSGTVENSIEVPVMTLFTEIAVNNFDKKEIDITKINIKYTPNKNFTFLSKYTTGDSKNDYVIDYRLNNITKSRYSDSANFTNTDSELNAPIISNLDTTPKIRFYIVWGFDAEVTISFRYKNNLREYTSNKLHFMWQSPIITGLLKDGVDIGKSKQEVNGNYVDVPTFSGAVVEEGSFFTYILGDGTSGSESTSDIELNKFSIYHNMYMKNLDDTITSNISFASSNIKNKIFMLIPSRYATNTLTFYTSSELNNKGLNGGFYDIYEATMINGINDTNINTLHSEKYMLYLSDFINSNYTKELRVDIDL